MENTTPPDTHATLQADSTLPSAFQLFKPSIDALLRNFITLVEILVTPIIPGLIALIPFVIGTASDDAVVRGICFVLAGALFGVMVALSIIANAGATFIQIKGAEGKTVGYKEAFDAGKHYAWRMLGLSLCVAIIYIVSLLLLVVPFFFMLRRYYLAGYYLVDRDLGVFEAMRQSAADSKPYSGPIWGIIGVNVLLSVLGVIPFIGWLVGTVAQVLYTFAPAIRYTEIRTLKKLRSVKTPAHSDTSAQA